MMINNMKCCGSSVDHPYTTFVVAVNQDPGPDDFFYITVQAGFPKISTHQESRPTWSETFEWPAWSDTTALSLEFTENLELAYSFSKESKRALC